MGMTLSTTAGTGLPLTMNQLEAFDPAAFEEEEGGPYEALEVIARTYGVGYELATYYDSHPEGDEFAAVKTMSGPSSSKTAGSNASN